MATKDGYEIKATEWHDFYTTRGKIKLQDLKPGDELLVQSGKGQFGSSGERAARDAARASSPATGTSPIAVRARMRRSSICGARIATTRSSGRLYQCT